MGSGNWTTMAYNTTIKNMGFSDTRSITSASVQTSFSAKYINPQLIHFMFVENVLIQQSTLIQFQLCFVLIVPALWGRV